MMNLVIENYSRKSELEFCSENVSCLCFFCIRFCSGANVRQSLASIEMTGGVKNLLMREKLKKKQI